jgi:hypothetical protein
MLMTIRDEQMRAFEEEARHTYERRLVAFLRNQFSNAAEAPLATLQPFVSTQTRMAERYGLVTEQHIAVYVCCAWALGADFAANDRSASVILSSGLNSAETKVAWLARHAHLAAANNEFAIA